MPEENEEPPDVRRRRWKASALCLVPLALLAVAGSLVRGTSSVSGDGRELVFVWEEKFAGWCFYPALVVGAALLVWCWSPARHRPYGGAVTVAFFVACGLCVRFAAEAIRSVRDVGWAYADPVVAGPGDVYRSGHGRERLVVARDVEDHWYGRTSEVVATWDPDDAQSTDALLIRPTGELRAPFRVDAIGRVYVTQNNDDRVDAAFDPTGPLGPARRESDPPSARRRLPPDRIDPFAVISGDQTGIASDVGDLLKSIADARDGKSPDWIPADDVLLAALDSPNPWIVDTAKRFIREGGPRLYPTAGAKIDAK
jgi:hypothetical protein